MKTSIPVISAKFAQPILLLLFVLLLFGLPGCTKDNCKDIVCPDCPKNHLVIEYVDTAKKYCDSAFHVGTTISGYSISSLTDTGQWLYSYKLADSCKAMLLPNPMTRYIIRNPAFALKDTITILEVNRVSTGQPMDQNKCCFCFPIEQVRMKLNNLPPEHVDMKKVVLYSF